MPRAPAALATVGIGSVPHRTVAGALEVAFRFDIPTLPELEGEAMVTAWRAPLRSWRGFVRHVAERRGTFAKAQVVGPHTLARYVPDGDSVAVRRALLARAVSYARGLREVGARPVVFLDEPGLHEAWPIRPAWIRPFVAALHREGAWVGVHCCGDADWRALLSLPLDVVSFDATTSLEGVLAAPSACRRFLQAGGRLALGVVPTRGARAIVPAGVGLVRRAQQALACPSSSLLLTPACGFAGLTVEQSAWRVSALLRIQAAALE